MLTPTSPCGDALRQMHLPVCQSALPIIPQNSKKAVVMVVAGVTFAKHRTALLFCVACSNFQAPYGSQRRVPMMA